ncbi:hypothetical protein BGZ60DRAFT_423998 [Tricladium varicosporioides]|nr:hypothetical protein BGZ60DRAFT_423998 [Hymenoscyphus varicosporioides]
MDIHANESISSVLRFGTKRRRSIAIYLFVVGLGLAICLFFSSAPESSSTLTKRGWGGWDERPQSEKCYKQERIATLLALYLGAFGADQWYAHHWVLAVFKMFTLGGFGIWALVDLTLWIKGGVYGTPGCPGGSKNGWAY